MLPMANHPYQKKVNTISEIIICINDQAAAVQPVSFKQTLVAATYLGIDSMICVQKYQSRRLGIAVMIYMISITLNNFRTAHDKLYLHLFIFNNAIFSRTHQTKDGYVRTYLAFTAENMLTR